MRTLQWAGMHPAETETAPDPDTFYDVEPDVRILQLAPPLVERLLVAGIRLCTSSRMRAGYARTGYVYDVEPEVRTLQWAGIRPAEPEIDLEQQIEP